MKRRRFMQMAGVAGAGLLTGLYTWQVEPFWLEFVYHPMRVKHLPEHLKGKTVMQISDMHVGNRFDYEYLIDSFKKAQKLDPDFVVYTGDFVNYENSEQFKQLDQVLKHAVVGKEATLGVLGNHDYGKDWEEDHVANRVASQLNQAGIQILRNEHIQINGLNFLGIDDYWATNFKPKKALQHYKANQPYITLCHNPDVCDLNVWGDYQGWILSGHTHGGQCKPPFLPPPMLPVKNDLYSSGEIDLKDGRLLYINRAIGHLWQVRFNVRPEITVFTLA